MHARVIHAEHYHYILFIVLLIRLVENCGAGPAYCMCSTQGPKFEEAQILMNSIICMHRQKTKNSVGRPKVY